MRLLHALKARFAQLEGAHGDAMSDLQEQIASHRLRTYYKQYGVAGAAQAWYAGEGSLRYSQAALNRKQGAYPSISNYVRDILRRAGIG